MARAAERRVLDGWVNTTTDDGLLEVGRKGELSRMRKSQNRWVKMEHGCLGDPRRLELRDGRWLVPQSWPERK